MPPGDSGLVGWKGREIREISVGLGVTINQQLDP